MAECSAIWQMPRWALPTSALSQKARPLTTIELKINFLRPVWNAMLRAEARVVRAGRVVGLIECDILDERRRLVARASSTCMTLRGRLAKGRQFGQTKENHERKRERHVRTK